MSTKDRFLSSHDYQSKVLQVPTWGEVTIRELTAKERLDLVDAVGGEQLENREACSWFCKLIAMSVIETDGTPVFDQNGDIDRLMEKPWSLLQSLANQIMEFNGMHDAEETAKN